MATQLDIGSDSRTSLLDAAGRLLIERGYAALSVRVVAEEAGVNHGLVRYYFGTLDNLLLEALKRYSEQLFERQRAMYAAEGPFLEKWRTAMGYMDRDDAGYTKMWLELQAMAWNNEPMRAHLAEVDRGWRSILRNAFIDAVAEYGLDPDHFPVEGLVSLVMTFNLGYQLENTAGIHTGHEQLLAMIDAWLSGLEERTVSA